MNLSHNKQLICKIFMNLVFWFSFGVVAVIMNWFQDDFALAAKVKLDELTNLIELKQFILLVVSGFSLYGAICFSFRNASTDSEIEKKNYMSTLALQEWSAVFQNFGSIVFVTGFLTDNYSYALGAVICYLLAYIVAKK